MTLISLLLTSSVLILVILLLRGLLRGKVGNVFIYALWLVVAARLLMPLPEFFLEKVAGIENPRVGSSVSMMNLAVRLASYWEDDTAQQEEESSGKEVEELAGEDSEDTLPEKLGIEEGAAGQVFEETEEGTAGQASEDAALNNIGTAQLAPGDETDSVEPETFENTEGLHMYEKIQGRQFIQSSPIPLSHIAGCVWLFGSLLLLCVQALSERHFRRRLMECREEMILCGQRVYKVRGISTPLLFRGRGFTLDIYIPEEIVEKEKLVSHAMLHENVHKKHGDVWWGYLRNLLVAAYWFHPLVWVAAVCSKRDCEYACDSSVTRQMNRGERISYGASLLSLVQTGREGNPFNVATLMSIKKSELKRRICLVKRGKRQGIVTTVLAMALVLAVVATTFTDARAVGNQETETREQEEFSQQNLSTWGSGPSELTTEELIGLYTNGELPDWIVNDIAESQDNIVQSENDIAKYEITYE